MTMSKTAKHLRNERRSAERAARIAERATPCDPICVECGALATELVFWSDIYQPRPERPDLMKKQFYRCQCGAYVGCHTGTTIPLGRPGGPATQRARSAAHAALDPMWRRKMERDRCPKYEARGAAYRWLAERMGLPENECHIGWMTVEQAQRVVEICHAPRRKASA